MKSKFKIGDEIFYMNYDEPRKGIIKGIAFVIGEFENTSFKKIGTEETPSVTYSLGAYLVVDEDKAFSTKEELQTFIFSKL